MFSGVIAGAGFVVGVWCVHGGSVVVGTSHGIVCCWKHNTGNKTDVTGVMYVFSVEGMNTFY